MARSVTAHGRSGQTVTASSTRTETTISVSGGGSGRTVHGRPRRTQVSGIGAATLLIFMAASAASSPPLGVDVTGTGAGAFAMSAAGQGAFFEAYTGTGAATIGALAGSAFGDVIAPVTGTGAGTLALSGTGAGSGNYPSGAADATLVLTADGAGQHLAPVAGAGSSVLALTATAAGQVHQLVSGTAAGLLALTAASAGTAGAGPSDPVPASIASPVVGTDLSAVYALRNGGTGPRTPASNGTWNGSLDAYLISKGFSLSGGMLIMAIGSSTVTVANYDFAGTDVRVFGSGTAIFNDCTWTGYGKGPVASCDSGGSIIPTGSTQTLTLNNCLFDGSNTWLGSGSLNHNYCRFKNQKQFISSSSFSATGAPHMSFDHCYITGGGVEPAASSHVELSQSNPADAAGAGTFSVTNCLVILSDGQATASPWGSAWTGIWSVGKQASVTIANSIHIGIAEVNANPINPNVINCTLAYLVDTAAITLTNNVWQSGVYGYTLNQNGSNKPADGGGNRTFANVALTAADFG